MTEAQPSTQVERAEPRPPSASALEEVTLGDIARAVRRYRPFLLLALAAVLLIGVLPAVNRSHRVVSSSVRSDGGGAGPVGSAPPAADESSTPASNASAPPTTNQVVGGKTNGLPSAGTQTASGPANSALTTLLPAKANASGATAGGDAMSAPDCDRATGRLMIPSKMLAPPCVPMWPAGADNGGATAQGVTAQEIKLVFYFPPTSEADSRALSAIGINDTPAQYQADYTDWVNFFSSHYETYGRKVAISFFTGSGTDAAAQRADAVDVATKFKPFATITQGACCYDYAKAMAARKVVTISTGQNPPQADYEKLAPYLYGAVDNGADRSVWFAFANYIGKRIAGKPAKWAGDPLMHTQTRKFGLIYYDNVDASVKALWDRTLASYGVTMTDQFAVSGTDTSLAVSQVQTAIDKFAADGINVVVPMITALGTGAAAMTAATNKRYLPEWCVSMIGAWTTNILAKTLDPVQSAHMYGEKQFQPLLVTGKTEFERIFSWEYGRLPQGKSFGVLVDALQLYPLFAGIHLAGPTLTPQSLNQALFDKLPVVGGAAQGMVTTYLVGYKPPGGVWPWANYASGTDFVDAWFDPQTIATDETQHSSPGAWWHLNGAKRYYGDPAHLSSDEPTMFDKTGAVVQFSEVPASDLAPDYPNKHCGHRC